MKIRCLFLFILFGTIGRAQTDYQIRVFDKNADKEITKYDISFNDSSFTVNYGNKELYFGIPKYRLDYKYLDIFLDTLNNPDDCWVLWMQDSTTVGVHIRKSPYCSDTNAHFIRNLAYLDKNPRNAFNWSDFLEIDDDFFLGATSGISYSGFAMGATLKYYQSAFGGYGYYVLNAEYSQVLTGAYKSGTEIGAGIRIGPVLPFGVSLNTLILDNKYWFNLRPEVGLDFGKFSLIYGYNIGILNNNYLKPRDRNYFKLSFAFNVSRPVKNYREKYPYGTFR